VFGKEAHVSSRSALFGAVLASAGLVAAQAPPGGPLLYRFEDVKSKVVKSPGGNEKEGVRVAAGDSARAGDLVRTGIFARTVIAVPDRASRFEVFSSTRVRLAGEEPGVLLVLESGRLKAFFDAFTGTTEERRVAAPGALLVVRGTRYGLEVAPKGEVVLSVFEGTVEVLPTDGSPRLRVERDEYCVFGPKNPPRKGKMDSAGVSERSWGSRGSGLPGAGAGGSGAGSPGPVDPGSQGRRSPSGGHGGR
jgi:hypothetical protein